MRLSTMWQMLGGRNARVTVQAMRMMAPTHRVAWLAAALRHGVLAALAEAPQTFEALAQRLCPDPGGHEALRAWLEHGVLLKQLRLRGGAYHLRGMLARRLIEPDNARVAAYVEGLAVIHHAGLFGTMDRITAGERPSLSELDHSLIARASELMAPVLREIVDDEVPTSGAVSLLELGCGTGHNVRHACERNEQLQAVGVDLDPAVSQTARDQLASHGLSERVEIVAGDLRTVDLQRTFDIVTMFNLIYYFPLAERGGVLEAMARHVAPGGKLVIATSCRGGTIGSNILDVWFSAMPETGPLPEPDQVVEALSAAGLSPLPPRRPIPGEQYCVFVAQRP
ncbi:MAG: methyltransferase domain-containing protein [Deltaproteobacteria bacterium]|nr:methyltransferase domain-containing protein [Deltaproteobacteria bacterium]